MGGPMGIEGTRYLVEQLQPVDNASNHQVKRLLLGVNELGDGEMFVLSELLRVDDKITKLYLYCNPIGAEGVRHVARALQDNPLSAVRKLLLDGLKGEGVSEGDGGMQAAADMLAANGKITKLFIGDNQLSDDGIRCLADAVKVNKALKHLRLSGNRFGVGGMACLGDALTVNQTLGKLSLDCWRYVIYPLDFQTI